MKALKYSDICLIPNYSEVHSRADCDTSIDLFGKKYLLPIIPANMKSVIDMNISKWMSSHGYFYIMHRFDSNLSDDVALANSEGWDTISFSVGVKLKDKLEITKISKCSNLRVDFITIDIAHGYCQRMKGMINHIKKHLPKTRIIAGNVASSCAVKELANWGADIVKVGIGQGSPCTTKDKTGFTMPMFTCVQECSNVISDNRTFVPIIADGGIKCNGDIAKSLVAGARMAMAGGLFAACTDSPAVTSTINDVPHKAYFGSASAENKGHSNNIEGRLTNITCNSMTIGEKFGEITQDLQSSISYAGGSSLKSLKEGVKYREIL
jgi:GMP reductase